MNRDDLLKRCVDRRVAHETSVVAVSHLFYVYLLSALKKGQQVEVPNFGTFGTHMVGVKRQRRMPFFDVEKDLAEKVNERYRNLKTLLIGKYELIPAEGEVEYEGKEPKYDPLAEKAGKEAVLDTDHEVAVDEFRSGLPLEVTAKTKEIEPRPTKPALIEQDAARQEEPLREQEVAPPIKEKKLMPKLNLRGEGMEDETPPVGPAPEQPPVSPPTLRDISGGEGPSPLLQILLGLLILGAITFALNYFGVIHLWGKKTPMQQTVEETLPPVVQPPTQTEASPTPTEQKEEASKPPVTEKKEEVKPPVTAPPIKAEPTPQKEVATTPSTGMGNYTVQVSSWPSRSDADRVVSRLGKSGFDGYIAEGFVKGKKWFRVRVGRYLTSADAQAAATKLKTVNEDGVWVTKFE